MSSNWIRIRVDLLTNPKMIAVAAFLAADKAFQDWWTGDSSLVVVHDLSEIAPRRAILFVALSAVAQVWSVANTHSNRGFFPDVGYAGLDDAAGVASIGMAMARVGWARETTNPTGVILPEFMIYNMPARQRSPKTDAQRQAACRAKKRFGPESVSSEADAAETNTCHSDVTKVSRKCHESVTFVSRKCHENVTKSATENSSQTIAQEQDINSCHEMCHENVTPVTHDLYLDLDSFGVPKEPLPLLPDEKIEKPRRRPPKKRGRTARASFDPEAVILPPALDSPEFLAAWLLWVGYCCEKRKPLTKSSVTIQLEELAKWGTARSVAAIRHTVFMNWDGLREPDKPSRDPPPKKEAPADIADRLRQEREAKEAERRAALEASQSAAKEAKA